jgi:predicted metal-binding membrane protein
MAAGYFAVWLAVGVGIYTLGVALAAVAMRLEWFSRAVPWLLGASLIAAGAFQLTRWKMTHLLRCRSAFGCAVTCLQTETSFWLGCKQGAACCSCCAAPMAMQLALGIMNPLVMIIVALAIAAEKLLPRPVIVARLIGIAAIIAGIAAFCR